MLHSCWIHKQYQLYFNQETVTWIMQFITSSSNISIYLHVVFNNIKVFVLNLVQTTSFRIIFWIFFTLIIEVYWEVVTGKLNKIQYTQTLIVARFDFAIFSCKSDSRDSIVRPSVSLFVTPFHQESSRSTLIINQLYSSIDFNHHSYFQLYLTYFATFKTFSLVK